MDAFDYACEQTLGLEGGDSDVKGDRGGRTRCGITEKTFKEALERGTISGVTDLSQMTNAQIRAIYRTNYWNALFLNQVRDISIAAEIFDTAVNWGAGAATMFAQVALKFLGESITIDGAMGPITMGLINKWGVKDPRALMVSLNGFQFVGYCDLVNTDLIDLVQGKFTGDPGQQQFARGWTKRIQEYKRGTRAIA